jgi:hypothetical protein
VALFYTHNINEHTKLGIWRIEEPEAFYLEKVPLKKGVSHPYKRLQHLAGRFLLPTLYEDFPPIPASLSWRVSNTTFPFPTGAILPRLS